MFTYKNEFAFPAGTKFAALFTIVAKEDGREIVRQSPAWSHYDSRGREFKHRRGEDTMKIGNWVLVTGDFAFKSFYVQPTKMFLDWANEHMSIPNRDTSHFEAFVEGSTVIMSVVYGQIIGSHLLGVFDISEISALNS